MDNDRTPLRIDIEAAAAEIGLPPNALEALVVAGYLAAGADPSGGHLRFDRAELKAFVARNADNGAGGEFHRSLSPALEPQELVALLDQRAEHMASRLLKMYSTVFPQAAGWSADRQHRFVQITKRRFEAILAIATLGDPIDPSLRDDLERIGASAAKAGVKLPQILTMLRVARDLVVQNAIDLAEIDDRQGSQALSLLVTRILPAMDQLGDALTAGYWEAMFPV